MDVTSEWTSMSPAKEGTEKGPYIKDETPSIDEGRSGLSTEDFLDDDFSLERDREEQRASSSGEKMNLPPVAPPPSSRPRP